MEKIKNTWKRQNLILKIFILITFLLVISSIMSLNKAKVFQIIPFYILGIWTLTFLVVAIYAVIKKINMKITKKFLIYSSIILACCALIYIYIFTRTRQIYTWDQCGYYQLQINLLKKFDIKFLSGIKKIISTTYKEDYGYFLLSFTSMFFNLTDKTENSFILTFVFCEILPVLFVLLLNGKNIIDKFKVENENKIMISAGLILLCFPLLHKAAITGQPDIFGLFFVGLIVLLTTNYNFSEKDITRWIYIVICTFLLAITRRWYIFWIIGYYISYAITLVITTLLKRDIMLFKKVIINGLMFALCASLILLIVLFPIIKRTIIANYAVSYSAWDRGGIIAELKLQFQHIGILTLIICIIGIIYGIFNKNLRKFTICWILTYIITLFLFNRIQTMWYHQSLILVPEYMIMIYLTCISISKIKNTIIYYVSQAIFVLYLALAFIVSITNNKYFYERNLFSNISIKPVLREDYENIGKIVDFLISNCDFNKDWIYCNFASSEYCGDTFRQYLMPNEILSKNICYGGTIDSAAGFSNGIFYAKYVLIANRVIDATGATKSTIIPTINEVFSEENIVKNKFKLVKEFPIIGDLKFYCYERIKPFDIEEGSYWKELFEEQTRTYPDKFGERIDEYIKENIK